MNLKHTVRNILCSLSIYIRRTSFKTMTETIICKPFTAFGFRILCSFMRYSLKKIQSKLTAFESNNIGKKNFQLENQKNAIIYMIKQRTEITIGNQIQANRLVNLRTILFQSLLSPFRELSPSVFKRLLQSNMESDQTHNVLICNQNISILSPIECSSSGSRSQFWFQLHQHVRAAFVE